MTIVQMGERFVLASEGVHVPAFETLISMGALIVQRWGQAFLVQDKDPYWRLCPHKRYVTPAGKSASSVDTVNYILVEKKGNQG